VRKGEVLTPIEMMETIMKTTKRSTTTIGIKDPSAMGRGFVEA
jgi:hypothetical protein